MVGEKGLGEMPDGQRYADLVSYGRIDELLNEVSEQQIAEAWARYQNRYVPTMETPDDDPDWWAVDLWATDEWLADERRVRDGILRLVDLAASDAVLEMIGVSIMEGDFFTAVPSRVEWVEGQARESARFRRALANLWLSGVGEDVLERLDRAAGKRLVRFPPREEWPPELRRLDDARVRIAAAAEAEWWSPNPTPEQVAAADELLRAGQEMLAATEPFSTTPKDAESADPD